MIVDTEAAFITEAVRQTFVAAGATWPPEAGPVPLDSIIGAFNLAHDEVSGLTRAVAAAYLARWNIERPELLRDGTTPLAGFLFANADGGYILVRRDDQLPRRRFSAAHELGHYRLHFRPASFDVPEAACILMDDGLEKIRDHDGDNSDQQQMSLAEMERQANRFAAELLMPENLCRSLWEHYAKRFGPTARFIVHHLASDLLVSREAARWRLRQLGLIPPE